MGVNRYFLQRIKELVDSGRINKKRRVMVCLGYPDLLVDHIDIQRLFGDDLAAKIPRDPGESAIKAWHRWTLPVYDSLWLFRHMGFEVRVIDKIQHRGFEIEADLNEPLGVDMREIAGLVIDTGTCEHCFNVGTAFRNMCEMVARGGAVITAAPANKMNHGYFNFCPVAYPDTFHVNGFELLRLECLDSKLKVITVPSKTKIGLPHGSTFLATAIRREIRSWAWPIQGKYL